jgi:hypothetical protein
MLSALALAVNAGWLSTAAAELRAAADAAALAAAGEVVSDEWLRLGQPGDAATLQAAGDRAREFAALNRVLGQPVDLRPATDLALGAFDASGAFVPADTSNPTTLTLDQVAAVAVTPRRQRSRGQGVPLLLGMLVLQPDTDLQAGVVARLDCDVIGFRARPGNPIPLVPLGLRSDPAGADPASWEYQVLGRHGPDDFRFDPSAGFVAGGDGIPEFDAQLQLAPSGDPAQSNAYLLRVGAGAPGLQVTAGVSDQDLAPLGGQLVLGANNLLALPGGALGPADGSADYVPLRDGLELLGQRGLVRVWPLVAGLDRGGSEARVNAVVAARVVLVQSPPGGPLRVRLQPGMLSVPQAVTDAARRGAAYLLPSPYLARARLAR